MSAEIYIPIRELLDKRGVPEVASTILQDPSEEQRSLIEAARLEFRELKVVQSATDQVQTILAVIQEDYPPIQSSAAHMIKVTQIESRSPEGNSGVPRYRIDLMWGNKIELTPDEKETIKRYQRSRNPIRYFTYPSEITEFDPRFVSARINPVAIEIEYGRPDYYYNRKSEFIPTGNFFRDPSGTLAPILDLALGSPTNLKRTLSVESGYTEKIYTYT